MPSQACLGMAFPFRPCSRVHRRRRRTRTQVSHQIRRRRCDDGQTTVCSQHCHAFIEAWMRQLLHPLCTTSLAIGTDTQRRYPATAKAARNTERMRLCLTHREQQCVDRPKSSQGRLASWPQAHAEAVQSCPIQPPRQPQRRRIRTSVAGLATRTAQIPAWQLQLHE